MKDDGSGRKIAAHAVIGGIMSKITSAGFASGAAGADLNEVLINAIKEQDPGTVQIVSVIVGAAAAKAVGGNEQAGASATASGTKYNLLGVLPLALSDYILAIVGLSGYTVLNTADGRQLLMNATG